jgi:hypothetical protein
LGTAQKAGGVLQRMLTQTSIQIHSLAAKSLQQSTFTNKLCIFGNFLAAKKIKNHSVKIIFSSSFNIWMLYLWRQIGMYPVRGYFFFEILCRIFSIRLAQAA